MESELRDFSQGRARLPRGLPLVPWSLRSVPEVSRGGAASELDEWNA